MAVHSLTSEPAANALFYLDTSAVWSLASLEASRQSQTPPAQELARAKRVRSFLRRASAKGCLAHTTVLSIEEIAAKMRGRIRNEEARNAGFGSWNAARRGKHAASIDAKAHAAMLSMITFTTAALVASGVLLRRPWVGQTETETKAARLVTAHEKLMKTYRGLDPMDALHIAVGLELGGKNFITFDAGWSSCALVEVYN